MQDLFVTCLLTTFCQMPMFAHVHCPSRHVGSSCRGPKFLKPGSGAGRAARGLSIFSWKQSSINPGSTLTITHPGGWLSWILDLRESQSIYLSYLSKLCFLSQTLGQTPLLCSCSFCWPCLLPRQAFCVEIHYKV